MGESYVIQDQSSQQSTSTGGEDYRKLIANEGGHYDSTVPSWGGGDKVNFMVTHVTPLPLPLPPPPSEVKYP